MVLKIENWDKKLFVSDKFIIMPIAEKKSQQFHSRH